MMCAVSNDWMALVYEQRKIAVEDLGEADMAAALVIVPDMTGCLQQMP